MPIYDFFCTECEFEFDALVRGTDVPVCPECGSAKVRKLLSIPAAPGKSKDIIARARRQAAQEGHFGNYAASERPRRK
jgi:putative FmdB family regulatory protein